MEPGRSVSGRVFVVVEPFPPRGRVLGMRTILFVPLAAAVALATAAPASAESAVSTIGLLESQGYHVNIDRVGSAPPLDRCVVTSVRNPQEQKRLVQVDSHGDRDIVVPVVVRRTITVSLDCSR